MSTTDALTISSAPDALTRYYYAKEREESAVLYINDAYLEVVNALEKLENENAKLRELAARMARALGVSSEWCDRDCEREFVCDCEPCPLAKALRELGVEVD